MPDGLQIKGDKKTIRALEHLGRAARKVARSANARASTVLVRQMRKEAPKVTGALRRSHGKNTFVRRDTGEVITKMGPRAGWEDKKSGKKPMVYARRVHQGNPWLERAVTVAEHDVYRKHAEVVRDGIEKEARRG